VDIFGLIIWFGAGVVAGWVANYLADVLPVDRKISVPICLNCGLPQSLGDYLLLRGCEKCGKNRSVRTWIVIFVFVALGIILWLYPPERMPSWMAMILLLYLGVVAIIDVEHRLILHVVSLAGAVLGLGIGVFLHGWVSTLIGGFAGFSMMLGLYLLGELFGRLMAKLRGQTVDEVALGFGDVNLSGVLGLILGWPGITACLLGAILLGGLISGFYLIGMLLVKRYKPFTALPYAPFLILAAVALLFRPA